MKLEEKRRVISSTEGFSCWAWGSTQNTLTSSAKSLIAEFATDFEVTVEELVRLKRETGAKRVTVDVEDRCEEKAPLTVNFYWDAPVKENA